MSESDRPDPSTSPPEGPSAGWGSLARIAARAVSSLIKAPLPPVEVAADGTPRVVSPDTLRAERVPKGQAKTNRWPVLHAGPTPQVDLATWDLKFFGAVEEPASWTWDEFRALNPVDVYADMHCVTHWTRLDNTWRGVSVAEVMKLVRPRPSARFVLIHAEQGYTTNLPLDEFLGDDCLFAWAHDGRPLSAEHGGPLRLVVPRLYAWKSAKWVRAVEFLEADRPGFWEQNGYHNHGDPWALNNKGTDSAERYW